jgi:SHS2 domain-containing protein
MGRAYWEHFHHEADIGVRGRGPTLAAAFEQAALAMTAVIAVPQRVRDRTRVDIELEAPDDEFLLYRWLNELVYRMATRHMLFGRFRVHIHDHHLQAVAWGEPVDRTLHRPAVEIKGATLTALEVRQEDDDSWYAQCVVDV